MDGRSPRPALLSLAHLTILDADPLTLIDAASAGGFDAIGMRIVPPTQADRIVPVVGDEGLVRRVEERMRATGVRVLDVEAVWLMPHTNVPGLEPAIALGARLRAQHLLVVGNDPDTARQRDNFGAICELADRYGLGVVLEPMSYVQLSQLDEAVRLLDEVRLPNARLLIDALHFYRSGASPGDLLGVDPRLFPYVHLCDASREAPDAAGLRLEGRSGRRYPGEGELRLGEFMSAFPPGLPIAVEAPCAAYADRSPVERARICGAATRAWLSGPGRFVSPSFLS